MRKRMLWIAVLATLAGSILRAQDVSGDWQGTLKDPSHELPDRGLYAHREERQRYLEYHLVPHRREPERNPRQFCSQARRCHNDCAQRSGVRSAVRGRSPSPDARVTHARQPHVPSRCSGRPQLNVLSNEIRCEAGNDASNSDRKLDPSRSHVAGNTGWSATRACGRASRLLAMFSE